MTLSFSMRRCVPGIAPHAPIDPHSAPSPASFNASGHRWFMEGDYRSPCEAGLTNRTADSEHAPRQRKFSLAVVRLRSPFGPPLTMSASASSCPSSSQKHTGQISNAVRSVRVRCPQHGQRSETGMGKSSDVASGQMLCDRHSVIEDTDLEGATFRRV